MIFGQAIGKIKNSELLQIIGIADFFTQLIAVKR